MSCKCKITVLERKYFSDLAEKYLKDPGVGKCPVFSEGQIIIIDPKIGFDMPKGFCPQAWNDIKDYVYKTLSGETVIPDWSKDDNALIVCCADGVRPVIFKVERI
ncbi:MAG: TIGR04076 family protein [Oscillospiraceae bacterium]|nr:TIGR04076 family protein [Oscillospiraceae bacterium]